VTLTMAGTKPNKWGDRRAEVVPGILHTGVTILISSPKLGKTRMMLDMALAVAQGGTALGHVHVG
jgi:RecA-family ATPase